MYCYKCGKEMEEKAIFCSSCGAKLAKGEKLDKAEKQAAVFDRAKTFLSSQYKKIAIVLGILVVVICAIFIAKSIGERKTVLDVVKYSDDGHMVENAEAYLEKKNISYKHGKPDLYSVEPDKFLGFDAYYDWDVDDYRIYVTFDSKKEFNKAKKKIAKYLEGRVDSDFDRSEFAGYVKEDADRYWHAIIHQYDGEDVYCTDYYEEDEKYYIEATTMLVASGLEKLESEDASFVDAEYDKFIVIELYQSYFKLGEDFHNMNNDGYWKAEETSAVDAEEACAETQAEETEAPVAATSEVYSEYSDEDLAEYMRDNFYDLYPYIEKVLNEHGYDAKSLHCRLIWGDFDFQTPKLIFENKDGGVDVLSFSWQDVDCMSYNDKMYDWVYTVDDLYCYSVDEAYEEYVDKVDFTKFNLYDRWSFAKPEFEAEFARRGYDSNNIKCRYLGETMEGGSTIVFVNKYGEVDSLIWFWEDGHFVNDDRTYAYIYQPDECYYTSIQEAFDEYVRLYW